MKYTWEKDDVVMGRRVISYNDAESYMIGYLPGIAENKKFYLISGRDGMLVGPFATTADVVDHLNEAGKKPLSVDPNKRTPLNP